MSLRWILFDFANSAYALIVITLFYGLYFTGFVAYGTFGTSLYGASIALSIFCVGLAAPFAGSLMDRAGQRLPFLRVFVVLAALATMLLGLIGVASPLIVAFIFIVANTFFGLALVTYDSLVIDASASLNGYTRLSGMGWAAGYIGGPLCLICALAFLGKLAPETAADFQTVFVITGLFFALFALPLLLQRDQRREGPPVERHNPIATLANWTEHRRIFWFLIAIYFASDAIITIVYFTTLYARSILGLQTSEIIAFFIIMQIVAVPATLLFTSWTGKARELTTLILCIGVWTALVICLFFTSSAVQFYTIGAASGLVVGTTPAVARGYLARIIPIAKRSEFFGFNAVASRLASLIGPIIVSWVAASYGMRIALLTVIPFLLAAALVLIYLRSTAQPKTSAEGDSDRFFES